MAAASGAGTAAEAIAATTHSSTPSPPISPTFRSAYPSFSTDSGSKLSMNTMSTARSSYSGRLATPTSPLLYQGGVLTQGFVDSPSDIPGVAAFRSLFRSHPQHPDRVSSRSLDPTQSPTKVGSSSNKRRPSPLDIQGKREDAVQDAPLTNDSSHSNLSSEMEHLRRAVQQNLKDRPLNTNVDRSNVDSEDELGSRGQPSPTDRPNSTAPAGALALIRSSKQVIVVDTRPIDQYRNEHLPRSVHIAIPTPILRRMRKAAAESSSEAASWTSLAAYIHPPSGRRLWDAVDLHEHVDVILIGAEADPTINALAIILVKAIPTGAVTCLQGGWESIVAIARSEGMIITGEGSDSTDHPTPIPTVQLPNDPGPNSAPAPSQTGGVSLSCIGRNLPALSLRSTASPPRKHAPKLSLTFNNDTVPLPAKAMSSRTRPKPGGLTIDVGDSNRLAPGPHGKGSVSAVTPRRNHFTSVDLSDSTRRASLKDNVEDPDAGPSAPHSLFKPPQLDVSTILPSFLYLGPEIATRADVETLLSMGIRRVLNVAVELDDDENLGLKTNFERYYRIPMRDSVEESGVEKGIREACDILDDARLHSAPIYVHCKAGRSRSVTAVLAYLIHANAWTLKTSYAYVAERRQGISPNIGFVAELIQFEETELGKGANKDSPSETVVDDKRVPSLPRETKPMMRYTRDSLPPEWAQQNAPNLPRDDEDNNDEPADHTPENTTGRRQRQTSADIEVRKNGQWVHGRRAPVDSKTLQPGRRVSKAGLESMIMRPLEPSTPVE